MMNRKDSNIAKAVKSAAQEFDPAAEVILFGSRARNDARQDSDYDFLVLLNLPLDFRLKEQVLNRLYKIELEYDCVLATLVENYDDWQMLEHTPIFSEIRHDGLTV